MIYFDEKKHKYTNEFGHEYISVTTLIHKYIPEFDADFWSKRKAEERGVTQEEILQEWDTKRDNSIEKGNMFHNTIEDYILGKPYSEDVLQPIKEDLHKILDEYKVINPERRVYNDKYMIAGTIDLEGELNSGGFKIGDWKTNKKIRLSNHYQKMLPPLDGLDDCNFVHYTLQLNIYRRLLYLTTGNEYDMELHWINGYNIITYQVKKVDMLIDLIFEKRLKDINQQNISQ